MAECGWMLPHNYMREAGKQDNQNTYGASVWAELNRQTKLFNKLKIQSQMISTIFKNSRYHRRITYIQYSKGIRTRIRKPPDRMIRK